MSKERLEELAYNVGISLDGEKALMSSDDYDFLYNYALEQAERVADYEKRYEKHLDIDIRNNHKIQCLEYQIKRYREALEKNCKFGRLVNRTESFMYY